MWNPVPGLPDTVYSDCIHKHIACLAEDFALNFLSNLNLLLFVYRGLRQILLVLPFHFHESNTHLPQQKILHRLL